MAISQRSGFSLAEMLVAVALASIVLGAATRAVLRLGRTVNLQVDRAASSQDVRIAAAVITSELQPLGFDPGTGSDISEAAERHVVYRGFRSTYFTCAKGPPGSGLVVSQTYLGRRGADPAVDSVMVQNSGEWVAADLTGVGGGTCNDGSQGVLLSTAGPLPDAVRLGTPVRVFDTNWLGIYTSRGQWLGAARLQKARGRWARRQPIVGPLTADGLSFEYLAFESSVVRAIRFTIRTRRRGTDRSLTSVVALRNSG
ncbi:MAG: PilW family protein [Gemmatimonadales bacterium]